MALPLTRRRFTVHEYYQMAEAGILTEDDRVELIEGEIVEMSAIGSRHAGCVARVNELFVVTFRDAAQVHCQNPIRLSEHTEPVPDLALLRRRPDFYTTGHPGPDDVLLVVEVADTSLQYDRAVKLPLYAGSGIPEAWLLDLNQDAILVSRDPSPSGYHSSWTVRRGERLSPIAFPDRKLAVADLLG